MKKITSCWRTSICMAVLLIFLTSICNATPAEFPRISFNRVAIGGIQPFASKDYVRSIYGEPQKIVNLKDSPLYDTDNPDEMWVYGETFKISFINGYVFCVVSSGANGLKTPDGICVGDIESKVMAAYGQKWKLGYWYISDHDTIFSVSIQNGKVTQIYAGWNM